MLNSIIRLLFSIVLFSITTPLLANHGLEAMGEVIVFLALQAFGVLTGLTTIIIHARIKSQNSFAVLCLSTVINIGIIITNRPLHSYDYTTGWLTFWLPLVAILFIQIVMIVRYVRSIMD